MNAAPSCGRGRGGRDRHQTQSFAWLVLFEGPIRSHKLTEFLPPVIYYSEQLFSNFDKHVNNGVRKLPPITRALCKMNKESTTL